MKKAVLFSAVLTGFTAMVSQIVLIREFLIVFYGNELSMGFILASWLAAGAAGSLLAGKVADGIEHPVPVLSLCQSAAALMLPLQMLAVRSAKSALGIATGAIVPFFPMAASSLLILLPLCGLLGFIFSLTCRIYGSDMAAEGIGRIYAAESAGAIAGGLLASFVLIRSMDPVSIMALLAALNLAAGAWLALSSTRSTLKAVALWVAAAGITAGAAMWPFGGWETFRSYSMARLWSGYELLAVRNSVYGNIAVARCAEETSFFDNGLLIYTVPDRQSREEAAHFALLEHPAPESVLLVGGGVSGLIDEIAKHPVKRIDYVELDPLIIEMAKENLPKAASSLNDPRVNVKNTDGRLFVKTATEPYDCVIVNVGEPSTAQLNRFYTAEFFAEVRRILKKGGVLSFAIGSSENFINEELKTFLQCLYATAGTVFPDVRVMPGPTAYFLASDGANPLTYDYNVLMARAQDRNIDAKYMREYYLFSKLSPERVAYIRGVLGGGPGAINRDFRPLGYYYYSAYWMSHFKDSVVRGALKAVNFPWLLAAAVVAIASVFLYGSAASRPPSVMALAIAGFSSMVFQMVILLAFQIIYGYMFWKLGVILTAFMGGLLLGGISATGAVRSAKYTGRMLPVSALAASAYAAALPVSFAWLSSGRSAFTVWFGPNIMFLILPAAAGALCGFQFPVANKMYLAGRSGAGRSAGLNYGADLAGASLGALVTGAFLIPVAGIPATCLMVSAANLAVALVLLRRL